MVQTTHSYSQPVRILLAEDDSDDQFLFTEALAQITTNTHLTIVGNGKKALDKLEEQKDPFPDIIFLDINMPIMDGIECLKKIRANHTLKDIPCLIFSTSTTESVVEHTYKAGANLYVTKPTHYNKLVKIIEKVLQLNWKEYFPPSRELFLVSERHL